MNKGSKALWYYHRLRAMDAAEVFGRVSEKLRHKTERFAASARSDFRLGEATDEAPCLPKKSDAPAILKQTLAADAARLIAGKWSLYGCIDADVGEMPDWFRDYARGVSVPNDGTRLNHRSLPSGADVRTIWEINRWAEMVRLAMHGWLNDDHAAIAKAQSWLADWVQRNPVGRGIKWSSALEGGLRLMNFCWFDALVGKCEGLSVQLQEKQRELRDAIVPSHVWWVHRYLSFGSSANNHRLGELTGLLLAVRRWSSLTALCGAPEKLFAQVSDCVLSQFAEDGGNREQASHYHLFAFEMGLQACRAMDANDGPVIERLKRAAAFFVHVSHPQEPWDYGDNDDAQIVPLMLHRKCAIAEWRAWMSSDTDGDATSLHYWLGDSSIRNPQSAIRNQDWWVASESGMAVIQRDGWMLRLDASPLGFGKMAAHGHGDALHVSIWDGDMALVIDPGTGGYFGAPELRAELAAWTAHNGPQPSAGFQTPRRMGTFLLAEHHARPRLSHDEQGVKAMLAHEGHTVSRSVVIDDAKRVVVRDACAEGGTFVTRWCLAPECAVAAVSANECEITRSARRWRVEFEGEEMSFMLREMRVSRSYGKTESAKAIDATAAGVLRTAFKRVA